MEGWRILLAPLTVVQVARVLQGGKVIIKEKAVESIIVGDRIIIIHGQRRQNLYALLVGRIHSLPAIQLLVALVERWHSDLRIFFGEWESSVKDSSHATSEDHSINRILLRLQELGSRLSSDVTLRLWLNGTSRCPSDPEDIRRVAEILGMEFVASRYKMIYKASNRLSCIHRSLSRKLNSWLRAAATGNNFDNDSAIIDRELGLTFGDFRSSLQIITISKINVCEGPFSQWQLGIPKKGDYT